MRAVLAGLGVRVPAGDERQPIDLPLGNRSVPLKSMCSTKCASPVFPGGSSNEPTG